SITIWARTSGGCIIGGDAIGEVKKRSEDVGREAANKLVNEIRSKPTVDVHLADMLIPYMALADGRSTYLVRTITDHIDTNIWLMEKITGAKFKQTCVGNLVKIECEGGGRYALKREG
ncbi:MAG: RNA 3'-terminal phosphate cyclase, partial [Candidatus Bathyarchaeia archaeon]